MIEEIIDFQEENLWKSRDKSLEHELCLIGKYVKTQIDKNFFEYLADINMITVTLIRNNNENIIKLEEENVYKIVGNLKKYKSPKSLKEYSQLEVKNIEKVEDENIYLNTLKRKEEILKKAEKNKIDVLNIIEEKMNKKEKINLLYIVSKSFTRNNKKRDILNDLYLNEEEKEILEKYFGLDFKDESNIIRMKLEISEFFDKKRVLSEIRAKQKEKKIDSLVFIKGGGSDLDYFDDLVFCEKIVELGVPFITAIGHKDDNDLLLSQLSKLSDANYNTPTRLGVEFINLHKIYFNDLKDEQTILLKEKISENIIKIKKMNMERKELEINLEKEKNKVEDKNSRINRLETDKNNLEKESNKLRFKNIISSFIIVILLGYSIFSTFFMKREVKEKNEITKIEEVNREKNIKVEETKKKIEEVKKEEKSNTTKNTLKENLDNLKDKIIGTEKKDSNNNQKNISTKKVENKGKKLVYSEDDIYTILLWKGYRGERAIQEFQRDNGMKVTGKVDETLLKKLGIKVEYK